MNHSMINSSVTMNALQQRIDVLSNNLANVNTVGYKKKEATFEDILTNMKQQPKSFEKDGRLSPLGYNQGWGAKLSQVQVHFSQGSLQPTGNQTDVAIEGDGLFEVELSTVDATGAPVKTKAYTRDGAFQLSVVENDPDNVYMATKEGHFVLGRDGGYVKVPKGYKIEVAADGVVKAHDASQPEQAAVTVGQLSIKRAARPQLLQQVGDNLYAVPAALITDPATGNNNVVTDPAANPGAPAISVRQGHLEMSNVNVADEMSELMMVQRAFQLSSRALSSSDRLMDLTNNLRG